MPRKRLTRSNLKISPASSPKAISIGQNDAPDEEECKAVEETTIVEEAPANIVPQTSIPKRFSRRKVDSLSVEESPVEEEATSGKGVSEQSPQRRVLRRKPETVPNEEAAHAQEEASVGVQAEVVSQQSPHRKIASRKVEITKETAVVQDETSEVNEIAAVDITEDEVLITPVVKLTRITRRSIINSNPIPTTPKKIPININLEIVSESQKTEENNTEVKGIGRGGRTRSRAACVQPNLFKKGKDQEVSQVQTKEKEEEQEGVKIAVKESQEVKEAGDGKGEVDKMMGDGGNNEQKGEQITDVVQGLGNEVVGKSAELREVCQVGQVVKGRASIKLMELKKKLLEMGDHKLREGSVLQAEPGNPDKGNMEVNNSVVEESASKADTDRKKPAEAATISDGKKEVVNENECSEQLDYDFEEDLDSDNESEGMSSLDPDELLILEDDADYMSLYGNEGFNTSTQERATKKQKEIAHVKTESFHKPDDDEMESSPKELENKSSINDKDEMSRTLRSSTIKKTNDMDDKRRGQGTQDLKDRGGRRDERSRGNRNSERDGSRRTNENRRRSSRDDRSSRNNDRSKGRYRSERSKSSDRDENKRYRSERSKSNDRDENKRGRYNDRVGSGRHEDRSRKESSSESSDRHAHDRDQSSPTAIGNVTSFSSEGLVYQPLVNEGDQKGRLFRRIVIVANSIYKNVLKLKKFGDLSVEAIFDDKLNSRNFSQLVVQRQKEFGKPTLWILFTGVYSVVDNESYAKCKGCTEPLTFLKNPERSKVIGQIVSLANSVCNDAQEKVGPDDLIAVIPPMPTVVTQVDYYHSHSRLHKDANRYNVPITSRATFKELGKTYNEFCKMWTKLACEKLHWLKPILFKYKYENSSSNVRSISTKQSTFINPVNYWYDTMKMIFKSVLDNSLTREMTPLADELIPEAMDIDSESDTEEIFEQVVVVGNTKYTESLQALTKDMPVIHVNESIEFNTSGLTFIKEEENKHSKRTLWVVLSGISEVAEVIEEASSQCQASSCSEPLPTFVPKNHTLGDPNFKNMSIDKMVNAVTYQAFDFAALASENVEDGSAVFLAPIMPLRAVWAGSASYHSHAALHRIYKRDSSVPHFSGRSSDWIESAEVLDKKWLDKIMEYLPQDSIPYSLMKKYTEEKPSTLEYVENDMELNVEKPREAWSTLMLNMMKHYLGQMEADVPSKGDGVHVEGSVNPTAEFLAPPGYPDGGGAGSLNMTSGLSTIPAATNMNLSYSDSMGNIYQAPFPATAAASNYLYPHIPMAAIVPGLSYPEGYPPSSLTTASMPPTSLITQAMPITPLPPLTLPTASLLSSSVPVPPSIPLSMPTSSSLSPSEPTSSLPPTTVSPMTSLLLADNTSDIIGAAAKLDSPVNGHLIIQNVKTEMNQTQVKKILLELGDLDKMTWPLDLNDEHAKFIMLKYKEPRHAERAERILNYLKFFGEDSEVKLVGSKKVGERNLESEDLELLLSVHDIIDKIKKESKKTKGKKPVSGSSILPKNQLSGPGSQAVGTSLTSPAVVPTPHHINPAHMVPPPSFQRNHPVVTPTPFQNNPALTASPSYENEIIPSLMDIPTSDMKTRHSIIVRDFSDLVPVDLFKQMFKDLGALNEVLVQGDTLHFIFQDIEVLKALCDYRFPDKKMSIDIQGLYRDVILLPKMKVAVESKLRPSVLTLFNEIRNNIKSKMEKEFNIYTFKTRVCKNGNKCEKKDVCLNYHSKEDKRRCPVRFKYSDEFCPERKANQTCKARLHCLKAHTPLEILFHFNNFRSTICSGWEFNGACDKAGKYCTSLHPGTSEMFYHERWDHLYVESLKATLDFLTAAIKNLNTVTNLHCVRVLLITTSPEMANFYVTCVADMARTCNQKVTEFKGDAMQKGTTILVSTVTAILEHLPSVNTGQPKLLDLTKVKAFILDDGPGIFNILPKHKHHIFREFGRTGTNVVITTNEISGPQVSYAAKNICPPGGLKKVYESEFIKREKVVLQSSNALSTGSYLEEYLVMKAKRIQKLKAAKELLEEQNIDDYYEKAKKELQDKYDEELHRYLETPTVHPEYEQKYGIFKEQYCKEFPDCQNIDQSDSLWKAFWKELISTTLKEEYDQKNEALEMEFAKKRERIMKRVAKRKLSSSENNSPTKYRKDSTEGRMHDHDTSKELSVEENIGSLDGVSPNLGGVDVESLAKATYGKEPSYVLTAVKKALKGQGMYDASDKEVTDIYAKVTSVHVAMDYNQPLESTPHEMEGNTLEEGYRRLGPSVQTQDHQFGRNTNNSFTDSNYSQSAHGQNYQSFSSGRDNFRGRSNTRDRDNFRGQSNTRDRDNVRGQRNMRDRDNVRGPNNNRNRNSVRGQGNARNRDNNRGPSNARNRDNNRGQNNNRNRNNNVRGQNNARNRDNFRGQNNTRNRENERGNRGNDSMPYGYSDSMPYNYSDMQTDYPSSNMNSRRRTNTWNNSNMEGNNMQNRYRGNQRNKGDDDDGPSMLEFLSQL